MKLFYRRSGQGQPLIILHGLFGLSDNWNTISNKLSKDFDVITADLRNHGNSPHSDEWTYTAIANDIVELSDDLGLPRFSLIGHSLGGKISMQLASLYPHRLNKLVVADMAPKDYPGKQFGFIEKLLQLDLSRISTRREMEAELSRLIPDNATVQLLIKNIRLLPSETGGEWKFNLKVLAENQDRIGKTFQLKENIPVPALFIRGERSNYVLDDDLGMISRYFPNYTLNTVAGAGHWLHAEKPEEFTQAIRDFLQQ